MVKSSHHRSENTFRFQTFTERIDHIKIDVVRRLDIYRDKQKYLEEDLSHFGERLSKWMEEDLTDDFTKFLNEVSAKVQSHTELVHHKDSVMKAMKHHLQVENSMALPSLMDLLANLARDLREDFYEHFPEFFTILFDILKRNPQNTELLEHTFSCLAAIFFRLSKIICSDVRKVFGYFSQLLDSNTKEYIRNFAAESFGFIMKNIPEEEKAKFFEFLFKKLKKKPEFTEGVGRLLFEMLKEIRGNFAKSASDWLSLLLTLLGKWRVKKGEKRALPWKLVEKALSITMQSCTKYTTREHATTSLLPPFLTSIAGLHEACLKVKGKKQKARVSQLCRILRLLHLLLQWPKCVASPKSVMEVLSKLTSSPVRPKLLGPPLLKAITLLIQRFPLADLNTASVTSQIFGGKFPLVCLETFMKDNIDISIFDMTIWRCFLTYIAAHFEGLEEGGKRDILSLVTSVLSCKVTWPADGSELDAFKVYQIYFNTGSRAFSEYLLGTLSACIASKAVCMEDVPHVWAAVSCLAHTRELDMGKTVKALQEIWNLARIQIADMHPQESDGHHFLLLRVMLSLLLLARRGHDDSLLLSWLPPAQVKEYLLSSKRDHVAMLTAVSCYLHTAQSCCRDDVLCPKWLLEIFSVLEENFSHHSQKVRLLTADILSLFPITLPKVASDKNMDQRGLFKICLAVERLPFSKDTDRERQRFLKMLDFDLIHDNLPQGPFSKVPLRFFLGNMKMNYRPLWALLQPLVAGYALGLPREEFWSVFKPQLELASSKAELELKGTVEKPEFKTELRDQAEDGMGKVQIRSLGELFEEGLQQAQGTEQPPDFTNFRQQVWLTMQLFPAKCEEKTRELIPLFFRFLQNEYYPTDWNAAPSQSILSHENSELFDDENDQEEGKGREEEGKGKEGEGKGKEEEGKGEKEEEEKGADKRRGAQGRRKPEKKKKNKDAVRRATASALVAHLDLFAKFKNPNSSFRAEELKSTFFQLLEHIDGTVHAAAFACLLTYKFDYLMPYRENFLRLIDNKTFKDEIVHFSLDMESTEIKPQHRKGLLPILLRILYAKMRSKTGKDTGGRGKSSTRRDIIFNYLAGCGNEELGLFLELLLTPVIQFHKSYPDDPCQMVKETMKNIDLSKVLPLRRMKIVLMTIDDLMKRLRGRLLAHGDLLLNVLLGMAATVSACLEPANRCRVHSAAVNSLKVVRQMTLSRLIQFFGFNGNPLKEKEVEAVFEAVVWPQLSRLCDESLGYPSPLLRLINVWCSHQRYYPLLSKGNPEQPGLTPLSAVCALLNAPEVKELVSAYILDILHRLLTAPDENAMDAGETPRRRKLVLGAVPEMTPGVQVVLPYVPAVLDYLGKVVARLARGGRRKTTALEMTILAGISPFVEEESECKRLTLLLVPFLDAKFRKTQAVEENILTSLLHLIGKVTDHSGVYRQICSLFSVVCDRKCRLLLCDIFKAVTQKDNLKNIGEIVAKMNAWNPQRIEEPDYTARQEGFEEATHQIEAVMVMDVDFLLPVMHNAAFYLLQHADDLPMQWQSMKCLESLIQLFSRVEYSHEALRELITRGILALVKTGLRSKKETTRCQFMLLMRVLAETFPNLASFAGLHRLMSKSHDEDFFLLMADRQWSGWIRAMKKLTELLQGDQSWRQEVLTTCFLPVVSPFLLDAAYGREKFQAVRERASVLLGAICRRLSWHAYFQQYRLYLSQLTKSTEGQKFWVDVLSTILDAFHFDLSRSQQSVKLTPEEVEALDQAEEDKSNSPLDEAAEAGTGEAEASSEDAGERTTLTAGQATSIHTCILKSLLPQLRRCLTAKVQSEGEHKLSQGSKFKEDEEILRVPIAIAMVKLLKQLPQGTLEHYLPGILLRVCHFLRSRAQSVRESARKTLLQVVQTLGPRYFPYVLKEMRNVLTRGYQLHVLGFSLNYVLKRIDLSPGDLDPALKDLVEVLMEELFGEVAKEKDVEGIRANTFEARKKCSADSFKILAQHLSPSCLKDLVKPIRETLEKTFSRKVVQKVQELLKGMAYGLKVNKAISLETMMVFIQSLVVGNLAHLQEKKEDKEKEEKKEADSKTKLLAPRPADSRLLPKPMPRGGFKTQPDKTTSLHVLVEFGLELLYQLLKQEMLSAKSQEHLRMLNPFVEALQRCLASRYVSVNVIAIHCLEWMLKFPLPSFKARLPRFFGRLFSLIDMYNQGGAARGVNLDLVTMCFKTLTVLVRDVKSTNVSEYKLLKMVRYCSEDLFDNMRQHRAFPLLKAILSRTMKCESLEQLMNTVKEMITTSTNDHTRLQCRQVMLIYLMNYPMKQKVLQGEVLFFLHHAVRVDREYGQLSCLEMLASFFHKFPQDTLVRMAELVWEYLSEGLLLRGSLPDHVAQAFKLYLEKVTHNARTRIFRKATELGGIEKKEEFILWARTIELLVEVETEKFTTRMKDTPVLTTLQEHLKPDLYDTEGGDLLWDIALLRTLHTTLALLKHCDLLRDPQWNQAMKPIWDLLLKHLDFPEVTAHLLGAEIFRLLLQAWNPSFEELLDSGSSAGTEDSERDFLQTDTEHKTATMAQAFISHLDDETMDYENDTRRALADAVVENLVLITRFAFILERSRAAEGLPVRMAVTGGKRKGEEKSLDAPPRKKMNGASQNGESSSGSQLEEQDAGSKFLTAKFVYGKMIGLANEESIDNVKVTVRRRHVFRYLAALFELELDGPQEERLLRAALPPLQREINAKHPAEELKDLAQEVVGCLKRKMGTERFTQIYTEVLKRRKDRSSARKEKRAVEAVVHPDAAARKRLKKNLAKTEAKKRKIAEFKPNLKIKRRKLAGVSMH